MTNLQDIMHMIILDLFQTFGKKYEKSAVDRMSSLAQLVFGVYNMKIINIKKEGINTLLQKITEINPHTSTHEYFFKIDKAISSAVSEIEKKVIEEAQRPWEASSLTVLIRDHVLPTNTHEMTDSIMRARDEMGDNILLARRNFSACVQELRESINFLKDQVAQIIAHGNTKINNLFLEHGLRYISTFILNNPSIITEHRSNFHSIIQCVNFAKLSKLDQNTPEINEFMQDTKKSLDRVNADINAQETGITARISGLYLSFQKYWNNSSITSRDDIQYGKRTALIEGFFAAASGCFGDVSHFSSVTEAVLSQQGSATTSAPAESLALREANMPQLQQTTEALSENITSPRTATPMLNHLQSERTVAAAELPLSATA